jgi:hypothetical protein
MAVKGIELAEASIQRASFYLRGPACFPHFHTRHGSTIIHWMFLLPPHALQEHKSTYTAMSSHTRNSKSHHCSTAVIAISNYLLVTGIGQIPKVLFDSLVSHVVDLDVTSYPIFHSKGGDQNWSN